MTDPTLVFEISVFPNPVTSSAQLNLEMKETGNVLLQWINESGQVIINKSLGVLPKGTYNFILTEDEKRKMSTGMNLLKAQVNNSIITRKVLIF